MAIQESLQEKAANRLKRDAVSFDPWHPKHILRAWNRAYRKRRRRSVVFRLEYAIRSQISRAIKSCFGATKVRKSLTMIGCDTEFLRRHLEAQFQPGMKWENWGMYGWHIDHIIPCAVFDLTKPEEQLACFHYSNLQPLWAVDNLRKSSRLGPPEDGYKPINKMRARKWRADRGEWMGKKVLRQKPVTYETRLLSMPRESETVKHGTLELGEYIFDAKIYKDKTYSTAPHSYVHWESFNLEM